MISNTLASTNTEDLTSGMTETLLSHYLYTISLYILLLSENTLSVTFDLCTGDLGLTEGPSSSTGDVSCLYKSWWYHSGKFPTSAPVFAMLSFTDVPNLQEYQ